MPRKIDGSNTIADIAKRLSVSENIFRNNDGRKTRKDKKLSTIRKELAKKIKNK